MPDDSIERPSWLKLLFYEFLGSILLVFAGLAATVVAVDDSPVPRAFAEGSIFFIVALLLDTFASVHLNPAITLGVWIYEAFMRSTRVLGLLVLLVMYPLAQYAGAIVGTLLVWALSGERTLEGLGTPVLGAGVSDRRGFGTEIILVSILVFAFLWSRRLVKEGILPYFIRAFVLLFAILALIFIGVPISGANLNPMRYLAAITLAASAPSNWWVWVAAPFVGSAVAAAVVLFMEWFTLYTSRYVSKVIPSVETRLNSPEIYDSKRPGVLQDAVGLTVSQQQQQQQQQQQHDKRRTA